MTRAHNKYLVGNRMRNENEEIDQYPYNLRFFIELPVKRKFPNDDFNDYQPCKKIRLI